ncbi:NDR1/HIN1-like protein 10 [Vigna angularis]|uniref:NDR1/HIN1-like protein 10 n=1 Tax=Phaseolus angularis TaxID=3914 RepID=UPI000809FEE2|nr:NDR1/HIN1-like protein 10 [Vigna angularis]
MVDKQPQLNGAYYGPTIPPAEHLLEDSPCTYNLPRHRIHHVLRRAQPRAFKLHISDTTLTQFKYTSSDNTLRYNLILNFMAGNPNKKVNFSYESMESHVSYNGVTFASMELLTLRDSFRQHRQSTNLLNDVYRGNYETVLDQDQVKTLEEDEKKRVFHFSMRLHFVAYFGGEREQWWRTYESKDHDDGGATNVEVETRRGRHEQW